MGDDRIVFSSVLNIGIKYRNSLQMIALKIEVVTATRILHIRW